MNRRLERFVEIQKNARIGKRCKISSHTFICEGVTIEDNVFIGHGVMFINDSYPRATAADGSLQTEADWKVERTVIKKGASVVPVRPFFPTSRLAKTPLWEQAVSSPKMSPPTVSWRAIPLDFCVISNRPRRLQSEQF